MRWRYIVPVLATTWIFVALKTVHGGKASQRNLGIAQKDKSGLCHSKTLGLKYDRKECCHELDIVHPKTNLCISPCALKHQRLRYDRNGNLACICQKPFRIAQGKTLKDTKCSCRSPKGIAYNPIDTDGVDSCCIGEPKFEQKLTARCREDDNVSSEKVSCPYLSHWNPKSRKCKCTISGQIVVDGVCVCEHRGQIINVDKTNCVNRCKKHQKWDDSLNTCVCDGKLVSVGRLGVLNCVKQSTEKQIEKKINESSALPKCAKFEKLRGKLCSCVIGYWRDKSSDRCLRMPDCATGEAYDRQNNSCRCKPGFKRWKTNLCLPACTVRNSIRTGKGNGSCQCKQGYDWSDETKTACVADLLCGKSEVFDRTAKKCACSATYERFGENGCQPKCVASHSERVRRTVHSNEKPTDDGCDCVPGFYSKAGMKTLLCMKIPECSVFEFFNGQWCQCLEGFWKISAAKQCQKLVPDLVCGQCEVYDRHAKKCVCSSATCERFGENGCQPKCVASHSERVRRTVHSNEKPTDDGCDCVPGFYSKTGMKTLLCMKIPECSVLEFFNGQRCQCLERFLRNPASGLCQQMPICGINEVHDRETNACKCKAKFERWKNNACLLPCTAPHSHRVEGNTADGSCECKTGYWWTDDTKTACLADLVCSAYEAYDRSSKSCICNDYSEMFERSGCQPKCPIDHTRRVRPIADGDVSEYEGCDCVPGYYRGGESGSAFCVRNPVCGKNETFEGKTKMCACSNGYWRNYQMKICQKKPNCGINDFHNRPTNTCQCKSGYENVKGFGCQPRCGKNALRTRLRPDGCECEANYFWGDSSKSFCVGKDKVCGKHGRLRGNKCHCSTGCTEFPLLGCLKRCPISLTTRVKEDGDCVPLAGYKWPGKLGRSHRYVVPAVPFCGVNKVCHKYATTNRCACLEGYVAVTAYECQAQCKTPHTERSRKTRYKECSPSKGYEWGNPKKTFVIPIAKPQVAVQKSSHKHNKPVLKRTGKRRLRSKRILRHNPTRHFPIAKPQVAVQNSSLKKPVLTSTGKRRLRSRSKRRSRPKRARRLRKPTSNFSTFSKYY